MKKRKVILSLIGILLISFLLLEILRNNRKEYIDYSGTLLALTLDGNSISAFPIDNSKYNVTISCNGGVGKYQPIKKLDSQGQETNDYEMNFTIDSINKDGVKCNVDFTTLTASNKNDYLLKSKVESINTIDNNGYRYSGKQPDNWVWFNNELWRIIGSIPTTLSDGTTIENRVKIIRANSIGCVVYNSDTGSARWGSNTLYTLLNEYYYGKKDATGTDLCYKQTTSDKISTLCNYSVSGISSDSNDYYGKMILGVYMNVGSVSSSSNTISGTYTNETSALTTNITKIGLMTASDYGYGTSNITYSSVGLGGLHSYVKDNWLYEDDMWTMTRYGSAKAYKIVNGGYGSSTNQTNICGSIKPVIYLNPDVYIVSGVGTEKNPYILGI